MPSGEAPPIGNNGMDDPRGYGFSYIGTPEQHKLLDDFSNTSGGLSHGIPEGAAGFPQPSMEQIDAETDTLNNNPRPDYSPDYGSYSRDEVSRALERFGWRPDAADQAANNSTVFAESGPFGGGYYAGPPGQDRVVVNPSSGMEVTPFVIQHEMQHQNEYQRAMANTSLSSNPRIRSFQDESNRISDIYGLSQQHDYPTARFVAEGITTGNDAGGNPITRDTGHVNHYLNDRLNFDYSQLPPEYVERQFPYASPTPSFETFRRSIQDESDQMSRAQAIATTPKHLAGFDPDHPPLTNEEVEIYRQLWEQTPWWFDKGQYDPYTPPSVYGPLDSETSDIGNYIDRVTGEFIPRPRER